MWNKRSKILQKSSLEQQKKLKSVNNWTYCKLPKIGRGLTYIDAKIPSETFLGEGGEGGTNTRENFAVQKLISLQN